MGISIMEQAGSSAIIITGMHRSGTSLTASLLQRLGVNIGEHLIESDAGNIRGHFENADFVQYHQSVLQANGFDRLGCVVQPRPVQLTDDQIKAAQNLILRNQTQVLWGWKDPRTTLFLELWRQLIPISYYVFVYRSPWEVVDSFYRRATDAEILEHPEVAIEMWLHYNREILNFYQQNFPQCVLVNVRTVGETPQEFINELNRRFNLNLPPAPTDNFEPDLLEDEVLETPRPQLIKQCFPEAIDLYLQLEATAADLAGGLLPAEARILNHSPSLLWMFRDWSEVRRLEKDVKTWQDQFQLSVDRLVEAETELGRTQFRYESLEVKQEESAAKLLNLETELGETQLQLAGKETQLEAAAQKLSTLEAELGTAQLQRDGTQNNFQAALTKITALEEELGKSQRQLEDTEVYRQEAEVRVAQADTQLGQAELRILELEEQLEASQVAQQQAEARAQMLELPLQQAQEEIQAIKSSKIWRLRDRWHDTKQSLRRTVRARYIHHLDTPTTWEFVGNGETYTQIEGWCLYTGERTHTQVRACLGSEVTTGVYGIERLDVGQLYGWIPGSSQAGFRVQVQLPAGDHQLHLELQDNQGRWHRFASYPVKVSSLRAAFDAPVNWRHRQGEILFAGWCCHLTAQISQLTLECRNGAANRSVNCAYGLRRSDVGEVLPDWTGSSNSGFEALLELEAGRWQVSLAAQLETGETVTYRATEQLVVSREGALTQGTAKLRQLSDFTGAIRKRAAERKQRLGRLVPTPAEIPAVLRQMWQMYRQTQSPVDQAQLPEGFELLKPIEPYDAWLAVNQWTNRSQAFLQKRLAAWDTTRLPKISVVMPVYNPPIEFLEQAIISVTQQIYTNWELCIADDCSTDPAVGETLNRWAEQDQRIQVLFRSENGNISRASNTAAKQATGDFLLFLDNDDELTPNALAEVALHLAANPGTDVLYSDDDKIDPIGKRFAPQFKPKWSPELLLSYMYMGHVLVVRRQLFQQVSGFRAGYEGAQDYDLALRITEEARQIGHIPLVLYHWRTAPGSTAISGAAKPASFQAGCNAVQDALDRRQTQGTAAQPAWAVEQSLGIFAHQFPHTGPSVTIIIPTRNQLKLLTACVESLKKTTYENYQILIIDNDSDDRATLEYLAEISRDFTENSTEDSAENSQSGSSENSQASVQNVPTVKVLNIKSQGKFNFAAINNQAAQQTDTDYLLFLNNDTEVLEENWLSQMMGYAQLDRVGAVGARLIFPDNHIQHAGILHGLHHGLAGHAFKLSRKDYFGYLAYSKVARNYSAVTAACLLTPRKLFLELGGFDAENFAVAYNDADYGYRLHLQGYRSVYCADAELLHREGTSRGFKDDPAEVARFRRKYADKVDPYYSPHLSLANEWFQIQPRRLTLSDRVSKQTVKIKPKVLMCSNALEYTGAPLHQYEIALQLAAQGEIEPVIFCTDDGPLRQAYEQAGIPVIVREHPLINLYQRQQYETALEQYVSLLNLKQYDVVYANTLENFFMVDCAHRCQVPVIWNVHESEAWQSYFNRFGSEIAACALECFRYPYRIIFVADATRNLYQPLNSHHNFITIHNGLDINRFHLTGNQWTRSTARSSLNLQESEVVILLLGTVCERKGQHDLVRALHLIPPELQKNIRCLIVGDRPSLYSTELHKLVDNLPSNLREKVNIVPETPEAPKYYQAADIFICTSRIESYPRVILEAMAYELPMITTPVFGIVEQVRPNVNGLFYTPDKPEELAQCLVQLLNSPEKRRRFARNAKFVLESLNTFEEMVQDYDQIFQEAYFINPNPVVDELVLERLPMPPSPTVEPETQSKVVQSEDSAQLESENGVKSEQTSKQSQAQIYWEKNPTIATESEWLANPIIMDTLNQRMSGSESTQYWLNWLVEKYFAGKTFDQLISLGCGIGNHEIVMAKSGFARQIDAFDFSQASIDIAQANAEELGLKINFYQDDFNQFELTSGKKYDVAFCSGSLHHVKELERFLEIVHRSLNPDGYFIINEYVGANYCIYDKKHVELIERLYQCFDPSLTSRKHKQFVNPTIHQVYATDPSEAVRSELILPFIEYFFEIELYRPVGGGILHPLYPLLNHRKFLPGSPEGETIVRLLLEFEEILMEIPGGRASDFCLCIMRPKKF